MFTWVKDNIQQAERATRMAPQGEAPFKKQKENAIDYEGQVRQGINVVVKEPNYKLLTQIWDKPYFKKPTPIGGNPKKRN